MRALKWFVINGPFAVCIYLGFYEQHQGAYNLAMFFAWFSIVTCLFLNTGEAQKTMSQKGRHVPAPISLAFSIGAVLAFVWFGAIWTGAFLAISVTITEAAWSSAMKVGTLDDAAVEMNRLFAEKSELSDAIEERDQLNLSKSIAELKEMIDGAGGMKK